MTKAKKAIGVILAVVMLATMFAFGSFAAPAGNATFTVTPSATQVEVGDTVTVTVAVTTDYYAGPIGVPVHYDAALFDYVEGSFTPNADIYGAGAADANAFNNNGCLTVAFAPKSEVAGVKAQVLNNVTLFTFQLTAKANGVSPVQLKAEDQKALGNMTGKLYCGQKANSSITSADTMIGQTFTLNNASVTIGSAAAPELVAKAGTTGVVDGTNKYVYGVTAGTTAADYFEATNGGTLEWAESDAGTANGTGATVTLKDASGAVVDTYTLIIFGDLNGDGNVDSTDSAVIMQKVAGTATLTEIQTFAGDLNADGNSDSTDSAAIMQKVAGTANVTVNPYA